MISILPKVGNNFGRYAIISTTNWLLPSRAYYQTLCVKEIKNFTEFPQKKNLAIGLQFSSGIRHCSSASDKANGNKLSVKHDSSEQIFYVDVDGVGSGYLEYERRDELIILKHTYVSNELGGRGVGKILAKEALEYVAKNDLQLEIQCSFVREYVARYEPKYIKYILK